MNGLDGRRAALLVTPAFFGYERDIVAELERHGYATTFVDERPSNTAFARAVVRVRKSLVARRINRYYRRKADELAGSSFHLVIVIKAEVVPRSFLQDLRRRHPSARFVFYTYDALANAANCLELLDLFDERLSFDRRDVERRSDFEYLPLFYANEFGPASSFDRQWDLSFVGTLHSDRYRVAQRALAGFERTFAFFYVQARWYFAVTKYVTREHRHVPWRDAAFRPLARHEIANVFRSSRAVLDVQRSGQSGLTMRTFEVLASGAGLITTNDAIRDEPFYDPSRIVVISSDPAAIDADQLRNAVGTLAVRAEAPEGFDRYSIASWVARLVDPEDLG